MNNHGGQLKLEKKRLEQRRKKVQLSKRTKSRGELASESRECGSAHLARPSDLLSHKK